MVVPSGAVGNMSTTSGAHKREKESGLLHCGSDGKYIYLSTVLKYNCEVPVLS